MHIFFIINIHIISMRVIRHYYAILHYKYNYKALYNGTHFIGSHSTNTYVHMYMRAHACTHAHMYAPTYASAHARTHTIRCK